MKNEKIAAIALVIIVVVAVSALVLLQPTEDGASTVLEDIIKNLFGEKETIAVGDCADVHYIGRYASNNTVFDSSYAYIDNKTGGVPLNIFISLNKSAIPPEGYEEYSSGIIDGFMEGLIGLKEGEEATIGPIPPEKAYGDYSKLTVGDTFNTRVIAPELNQTVEVVSLTDDIMSLKWINVEDLGRFTMPVMILLEDLEYAYFSLHDYPPPYHLWENASEIINITDEAVVVRTTPTKTENITEEFNQQSFVAVGDKVGVIFPDATTAEWNETTITLTSSPAIGANYSLISEGVYLNITVENVTDTNINISYEVMGQSDNLEVNRTLEFDRNYSFRRIYDIPLYIGSVIIGEDIGRAGYSLHHLAGETLIFEVEIAEIYKTSQEES